MKYYWVLEKKYENISQTYFSQQMKFFRYNFKVTYDIIKINISEAL